MARGVRLRLWLPGGMAPSLAAARIPVLELSSPSLGDRRHGDASFETVWRLLYKVRAALAERSDAFPLHGVVEVDETYTGGKVSKNKGGRCLDDPRRSLVALAVERKVTRHPNPGIRGSGVRCGSARMAVLPSAAGTDLMKFVESAVAKVQTIRTDGWSGYRRAGVTECLWNFLAEPGGVVGGADARVGGDVHA